MAPRRKRLNSRRKTIYMHINVRKGEATKSFGDFLSAVGRVDLD